MKIQDLKVGDLVVEAKQLFIIMNIYKDLTGTFYDLKGLKGGEYVKAIPRNRLRHADKLISRSTLSEKTLRILYG